MKDWKERPRPLLLSWCLALTLVGGCSRAPKAPEPIPVAEAPETMESVFKEAKPEVQTLAREAVAALQKKDDPRAFFELQALTAKPELTEEQRAVVTRVMISVNQQLHEAAARGDRPAAEALEIHRARK